MLAVAWRQGGRGYLAPHFCQSVRRDFLKIDEKIGVEGAVANPQRSRECGQKFSFMPPAFIALVKTLGGGSCPNNFRLAEMQYRFIGTFSVCHCLPTQIYLPDTQQTCIRKFSQILKLLVTKTLSRCRPCAYAIAA